MFMKTENRGFINMRNNPDVLILILALIIMAISAIGLYDKKKECEAKGGVLVRSIWYECVKGIEHIK